MAEKTKEPEGVGQEIETEGGEVRFEPVKKIEEDGLQNFFRNLFPLCLALFAGFGVWFF